MAQTPMMRQYLSIKKEHPNTLLFFRMGDFYELFFDDAVIAARELELTLTSRNKDAQNPIPMCGVPYHAVDNYLSRIVKKGYRAALCDQVEDPKTAKGIVKREVTQVLTPGTLTDNAMLAGPLNNFLCALVATKTVIGLAFLDISTGDFQITETDITAAHNTVCDEFARLKPAECIYPASLTAWAPWTKITNRFPDITYTEQEAYLFTRDYAQEQLLRHFKVQSLKGFGCEDKDGAVQAAGAALHYAQETQKRSIEHLCKMRFYTAADFMTLDESTIRNLELLHNQHDNGSDATLASVIDRTITPMGGRLLRRYIVEPLTDAEQIRQRLIKVDAVYSHDSFRSTLRSHLKAIHDIERLMTRVSLRRATPRDMIALKSSFAAYAQIQLLFENTEETTLHDWRDRLPSLSNVYRLIDAAIVDEPPIAFENGGIIKTGFSAALDKLNIARTEGAQWIAALQERERTAHAIPSLKVKYNKVFGYYIEVSNTHKNKVPSYYLRKQTLVNAERYTTEELQKYESEILGAKEKAVALETELFHSLRDEVAHYTVMIHEAAELIALIDTAAGLAETARSNNYVMPEISDNGTISITEGRHPVVERIADTETFVPNDTILNTDDSRLLIITGPNMAGKSTYLRQVALICLLAQIGSFVPAQYAHIGIVDRIFTRIGASDNLARGESTFLVEMNETANIVHNATSKSLIIMDEIGRGTSTYDGLSIAWAVVEYLHNKEILGARTMFATHYHEMTELGEKEGIVNYTVLVKEYSDDIIFLRTVARGAADKSYGIHVAKLAGLPEYIITRARKILSELEADPTREYIALETESPETRKAHAAQLSLFSHPAAHTDIFDIIQNADINSLTPMEALLLLQQLKERMPS